MIFGLLKYLMAKCIYNSIDQFLNLDITLSLPILSSPSVVAVSLNLKRISYAKVIRKSESYKQIKTNLHQH